VDCARLRRPRKPRPSPGPFRLVSSVRCLS
jgi:hypothetical protein